MANNIGGFLENDEGPELFYTGDFVSDEDLLRMVQDARAKGIVLAAIWEAESSCVAIVPARVGKILVSLLNSSPHDPLEALCYVNDQIPDDVIAIRGANTNKE